MLSLSKHREGLFSSLLEIAAEEGADRIRPLARGSHV